MGERRRVDLGSDVAGSLFKVKCDVLTKLHQGTHSKDAFTNNLHELVYHLKCSDGTELHTVFMAAIGTPGEFTRTCDGNVHVQVGPAVPANSPNGGGQRVIPDRTCVEQFMLVPPGQHRILLRTARELADLQQRQDAGRPHPGPLRSLLSGVLPEPVSTTRL